MTTNQPAQTGTTRATKRSKYPARSARIISSGIAIASTLGISSAFTISAKAENAGKQLQNDLILAAVQNVLATVPGTSAVAVPAQPATTAIAAPTQPASAATVATPIAPIAPASQAPVVVNIAPPAPQAQWTPPATSGSN
jgi:hypothetical protein